MNPSWKRPKVTRTRDGEDDRFVHLFCCECNESVSYDAEQLKMASVDVDSMRCVDCWRFTCASCRRDVHWNCNMCDRAIKYKTFLRSRIVERPEQYCFKCLERQVPYVEDCLSDPPLLVRMHNPFVDASNELTQPPDESATSVDNDDDDDNEISIYDNDEEELTKDADWIELHHYKCLPTVQELHIVFENNV